MTALLFALAYLVVFLTALVPIQEPDFWWHLASGRWILSHHVIPAMDPFSWTARGTPWVDSYWAYDALLDAGFSHVGVKGLVFAHAFIVLGIFYIFDRRMRLENVYWGWRLAAFVLLLQGGGPGGGYWGAESSLVTLLFFSLLVWHTEFLRKHPSHRSLWVWPFLFVLWANLHRGFIMGWVVAAMYVFEETLRSRRWLRNSLWFSACGLATLITPYGIALYRMIWDDFSLSSQWIMGWGPTSYSGHPFFFLTLLCFAGLLTREAVSRKWRIVPSFALGLLLAIEGWRHVVYVPYFMVFVLPWIAARFQEIRLPWSAGARRWAERAMISGFAILWAGFTYARLPRPARYDGGPRDVFSLIRDKGVSGPFYNDYGSGGYWLWAFGGDPPVFIDGRYPAVQGYKPLMTKLLQGQKNAVEWRTFLSRYAIEAALVGYPDLGPLDSKFRAMFPRDQWALVYWDDQEALFLRRGKNNPIIREYEFTKVWPDITRPAFIQEIDRLSTADRERLGSELRRNSAIHPSSRRAQVMLDAFLRRAPPSTSGDRT